MSDRVTSFCSFAGSFFRRKIIFNPGFIFFRIESEAHQKIKKKKHQQSLSCVGISIEGSNGKKDFLGSHLLHFSFFSYETFRVNYNSITIL